MKRIPAVLLVLVLVFLCLFSAAAESETDLKSGDYSYRLQPDGTAVITRGGSLQEQEYADVRLPAGFHHGDR